MTAPALAAARFLSACVLGLGLGLLYDFLRPLRPRYTTLSDLLFLLGTFLAWLVLGFGVCGGDLRLGYCGGLLVGGLAFHWTFGQLLGPVFCFIWKIPEILLAPGKIFLKKNKEFCKFTLFKLEKMVYNRME